MEKNTPLYYVGGGYVFKTYAFRIFVEDGIEQVEANNGVIRNVADVTNNVGNLLLSKEIANSKVVGSWMAITCP